MHVLRLLLLTAAPALALAADNASGLDTGAMNKSVNPCVDFFQYACGNWIASHPLPADRSSFGRGAELRERNDKLLLDILQGAAVASSTRSAVDQKIGDMYSSCMDTSGIEKRGLEPLKPELERISRMASEPDVWAELIRLHNKGVQVLFSFAAQPDARDSTRTIASLGQGGLSLPDRDYYLKTDPKSQEIRAHFVAHVKKMFQLTGDPAYEASARAAAVLDFETILAKASVDRVTLRDPDKSYHIMTHAQLKQLSPWDYDALFQRMGAPVFETLNVSQPDFIKQIANNLAQDSTAPWKAYFAYHLLHADAQELPATFEDEDFDFWQRFLTGAKQPRPRNMRCVAAVDRTLGDMLGQKYVEVTFGADAKTQINQLVDALTRALGEDIRTLAWMSEATKKAALEKLTAITRNVGVPRKWRDYGQVSIARDDYLGNTERAAEFLEKQRLQRIGKPTDKTEWTMTTPTVNAFYSPAFNSINFPAGLLQPPFFDPRRDMALNYGAVGAIIGHEMTHGFDDQGRKYDGGGNLRDWWTSQDAAEFEKRATCVANEYSAFTAVDDVKLNGRLTLGENTADNGGLRVALLALEDTLQGTGQTIDGFTAEQRFFLGYAQMWCYNQAPQAKRQMALTDPHSPPEYRVIGTMQNMPEFQKAFACRAGQPMVSQNACRVW